MDGLDHVLSAEFQDHVDADTRRWDKEWLRYFATQPKYDFYESYFYDMSTDKYALSVSPRTIRSFTKDQMFHTPLLKTYAARVWVEGERLVDKCVLEIGCGPGFLGRIVSRFAEQYIGIDASRLALHIGELTSPKTCTYVHLSEVDKIRELAKSVDTCVGRYFFIHHNYADSLWILKFLRDLTKDGGIIAADFYFNPARVDGERCHSADHRLNNRYASALYTFTERHIRDLARAACLEVLAIDLQPEEERHFATFKVNSTERCRPLSAH